MSKLVSKVYRAYRFLLHYIRITYRVVREAYNDLLQTVCEKIEDTKSDVRKMVDHISGLDSIPASERTQIPLNPKRTDFDLLKYWENGPWQAIRNGTKGVKADDFASPILSLFMEDEFGKPISDGVKDEIRGDLVGYWNDIHESGETVKNYTDLGFKRREDFRKTMEAKYPWLRLCDGHWKAKQLWINYFTTWKKNHLPPTPAPANPKIESTASRKTKKGKTSIKQPNTESTASSNSNNTTALTDNSTTSSNNNATSSNAEANSNPNSAENPFILSSDQSDRASITPFELSSDDESKRGSTPIEIHSDETLATPTGSKRRHEDNDRLGPGPSKKSKGKEREDVGSESHPMRRARPLPTKKVKVAKVSNLTFLSVGRLLTIVFRLTRCIYHSLCLPSEIANFNLSAGIYEEIAPAAPLAPSTQVCV